MTKQIYKLEFRIERDESGKVHYIATSEDGVLLDEAPKNGNASFRTVLKMNKIFEDWCESAVVALQKKP